MTDEVEQLLISARKCGISKDMLCSIMNVSRRALYCWRAGGNISSEYLDIVIKTNKKLQLAFQKGLLPINSNGLVLEQVTNILSEINYD